MAVCSIDSCDQCLHLDYNILFKKRFPESKMTRCTFLKELGSALVRPQVLKRAAPPRSGSVQVALRAVLGELPRAERSLGDRVPNKKRNRCGLRGRSKDTKYNVTCTYLLTKLHLPGTHREKNCNIQNVLLPSPMINFF